MLVILLWNKLRVKFDYVKFCQCKMFILSIATAMSYVMNHYINHMLTKIVVFAYNASISFLYYFLLHSGLRRGNGRVSPAPVASSLRPACIMILIPQPGFALILCIFEHWMFHSAAKQANSKYYKKCCEKKTCIQNLYLFIKWTLFCLFFLLFKRNAYILTVTLNLPVCEYVSINKIAIFVSDLVTWLACRLRAPVNLIGASKCHRGHYEKLVIDTLTFRGSGAVRLVRSPTGL